MSRFLRSGRPGRRLITWAAVGALSLAPGSALAQEAVVDAMTPEERIAARAAEIGAMFSAEPTGFEVFGETFRQQVPDAALEQLFRGYHAEHGGVVRTEIIGPFTGGVTVVRFRFADETAAIMQFNLEPAAPHRVAGALLGPVFELDETEAAGGGAPRIREPTYATDEIVPRTGLRLPFEGEWSVFWGGRTLTENYHRASPGQRYAYDFVITRDGSSHTGEGTTNDDYYCHGMPIFAPATGRVVGAVDGVADNTPGEMNPGQLLGNHVLIDHGHSEFSLLAHLQLGSVAVESGDEVGEGDRVGACGNSGNSSEPHLHYQLQDGPEFGVARSIPAPFHSYSADGHRVDAGEPVRGQTVARTDR